MRQQDQSPFVAIRIYGLFEPRKQWIGQPATRLKPNRLAEPFAFFEDRHFAPIKVSRVITCVETNDAPVFIFEAEKARPLAALFPQTK